MTHRRPRTLVLPPPWGLALLLLLNGTLAACANAPPKSIANDPADSFEQVAAECEAKDHIEGTWAYKHCQWRGSVIHFSDTLSRDTIYATVQIERDWRECDRASEAFNVSSRLADYDSERPPDDVTRQWARALKKAHEEILPGWIARYGEEQGRRVFQTRIDAAAKEFASDVREKMKVKCHWRAAEEYEDLIPLMMHDAVRN